MTKWTIYDRDGNVLHESLTEYNSDGKIVYQDTFEYSGKWMGERFLTVSVKSAYPIDFQIGDYIDYRGERFTINYDPTVIKKARRGTYGEGFTYDSIKFNSYSNELTQMRFHDWVLSDNTLHYTSLPNFSFYAKDVDDLVDRLQACADRWCKDNKRSKEEYWMFYTLRNNTTAGTSDTGQTQTYYERTTQRANDILESCGIALDGTEGTNFLTSVQTEWEKMYGSGDSYTDSRDDERYDRSITVSNQTVWEGLSMIKQQFGLNFIIRGRNVYVGTAGIPTTHIFTYGKGNGLYEIDRTADQDQLVVTRLHAYGSDENLPTRYYADLNAQPYCLVSKIISQDATSDKPGVQFVTDLLWDDKYFNNFITEAWNSAYRVVVSCGSVSSVGFAWQYTDGDTTKVAVTVRYAGTTANSQLLSYDKDTVSQFVATVAVNAQVTFQAGANTSVFPSDRKTYVTENLPDNMAVNFLMLPGFPNNSLADLCKAEYDSTKDVTNYYIRKDTSSDYVLFHTESGNHVVVFSEDQYDPYIVSPNADTLGIKDGDISCTEENDDNGLEKVYPTIEEMTVSEAGIGSGDTRVDAVVAADAIDDNGVYPKGTTQEENIKGFHIYLPALGFDLRQAAKDAGGSEMQIIMQDGFCGARTFTVSNCSQLSSSSSIKQTYSNAVWDLSCKRTYDSSLDLYFPYSYAKSVSKTDEELKAAGMSNAYQIVAGDHYVLTGISVSDVNYVYAASVRLLRKAIHWLLKNDYTRYVYNPKIDEIYMAREAVIAKSLGNTPLHDALVEGDIMLFKDDDLRIDGSVYIDQLTIKENGNNGIPTYEVTLRNEVTVGTIQRLQNQVDSIKNDVKTGNVGGGLTNPTQVAALIQAYGNNWFLSKTSPDTASGKITFADGLASNNVAELLKGLTVGDGKYGITEEGVATLAKVIANSLSQFLGGAQFGSFTSGIDNGTGGQIDQYGNGELESLTVRSFLRVMELLVNRYQAQEGDTIFSENDQIDSVEETTIDDVTYYTLTLKEKWEGYYTAQKYGNIIKGRINTLAAKEAGISDYSSTDTSYQGQDAGGNLYYTSWMRVVETVNYKDDALDTAIGELTNNQIRVVLYGDTDTPAQKNFPPCRMMVIVREGCIDYGDSTDTTLQEDIKRRQQVFYLSTTEGRIVKLTGVNKPILEEGNYGVSLGFIPDFIKQWDSWERLKEQHPHLTDRDYLYAQGLIYEDLVHVNVKGAPVPVLVECTDDWIDGSTATGTITDEYGDTVSLPAIKHGIYFNCGWNPKSNQFERHVVRHTNGRWMCLQNQPVVSGETKTYYEPKWNSPYWKLIDGDGTFVVEFVSSNGSSFRRGYVNTVITAMLFCGNVEITDDIAAEYFSWTRTLQTPTDESKARDTTWNAQHKGMKALTLTNDDMDVFWSSSNKMIFTCTVVINDGTTKTTVSNEVIA